MCGGSQRIGTTQLAAILVGKGRRLRKKTMREYIRRVEGDRASTKVASHVLKAIERRFPSLLSSELR